jgi:hypothetical protein
MDVLLKSRSNHHTRVCGEGYSGVGAMKQSVIKGNGVEERRRDEGSDEAWVVLVLVGVVFDDT